MVNLVNHKVLEKIIDEQVNARLASLIARIEELERQKVPEYMTKQEAARYLKCSTSTIDNYVKRGLKKVVLSKGKVLFERSDLDEFMKSKKY